MDSIKSLFQLTRKKFYMQENSLSHLDLIWIVCKCMVFFAHGPQNGEIIKGRTSIRIFANFFTFTAPKLNSKNNTWEDWNFVELDSQKPPKVIHTWLSLPKKIQKSVFVTREEKKARVIRFKS